MLGTSPGKDFPADEYVPPRLQGGKNIIHLFQANSSYKNIATVKKKVSFTKYQASLMDVSR